MRLDNGPNGCIVVSMDHIDGGAGPLIRDAIKAAGRSQRWTAEAAGIPHTTFQRKLDGHTDFYLGEIRRIARALGVTPSVLTPADLRETEKAAA